MGTRAVRFSPGGNGFVSRTDLSVSGTGRWRGWIDSAEPGAGQRAPRSPSVVPSRNRQQFVTFSSLLGLQMAAGGSGVDLAKLSLWRAVSGPWRAFRVEVRAHEKPCFSGQFQICVAVCLAAAVLMMRKSSIGVSCWPSGPAGRTVSSL